MTHSSALLAGPEFTRFLKTGRFNSPHFQVSFLIGFPLNHFWLERKFKWVQKDENYFVIFTAKIMKQVQATCVKHGW